MAIYQNDHGYPGLAAGREAGKPGGVFPGRCDNGTCFPSHLTLRQTGRLRGSEFHRAFEAFEDRRECRLRCTFCQSAIGEH